MKEEYTWYDLQESHPFRAILAELCDWDYCYEKDGRINRYYVEYDEQKLRDNWSVILKRIKNKFFYKRADTDLKQSIDEIKENICDYDGNASAYYSARNFLLNGALDKCGSYEWDIANRYVASVCDYQKEIDSMVRPLVRFFEYCGWEGESWNFYCEYPKSDDQVMALNALKRRLDQMESIDQVIGKSSYRVLLAPTEYDQVRWNSGRSTYMNSFNHVDGTLNIDLIYDLIQKDDQGIFDVLYKGGFRKLCA